MDASELENLIDQLALGHRPSFSRLYDATSAKLFGVCVRILKNPHDAEEALQDVYIKIWQRAASYRRQDAGPMSWLVTIARHRAIDLLRRRKPRQSPADAARDVADTAPTPEAVALNVDLGRHIDICLSRLDGAKARAVKLAYVEGYSYAELAQAFDVPLNTMRTWLRRSLISLKKCMGQ